MTDKMAWGAKVSPAFRARVITIADSFGGATPSDLMSCIAQETDRTFSPSIVNRAGSGATGLLQFMPQTAGQLHTTTAKLALMSAVDQLDYVDLYFRPWHGKLRNIGDLYCAVLWPAGIGEPDNAVLFDKGKRPTTYLQNRGLDFDHDGAITRAEVTQRVRNMLVEGLKPGNAA